MFVMCVHYQVQGKDPSVDITQDVVDESEEDRFEELPEAATPIELPPCELSRLEEIAELFCTSLQSPIKREKLAIAIEKDNYIRKLIELFCICEDLENTESLHFLYEIMKNTILLNKTITPWDSIFRRTHLWCCWMFGVWSKLNRLSQTQRIFELKGKLSRSDTHHKQKPFKQNSSDV